uniref:Uncharacterized protein n=1 Tax=Pseudomonas aeruginosa TaxID=287 RepID=A0A7S5YBL7_PSEAI|nr:hypothetical protein [Pseudomonas aeruginosa]
MRPTYNNIAVGALRPGGAPFSFHAGAPLQKPNLAYYPRPWQLGRIRSDL